jgi:thioredoxin 1
MVEHLTDQTFKEKVFDYEKSTDWKFEGGKPALIDFYADWCQPCKMVAPIIEELADEYQGRIDIYKINTEKERKLSSIFDIQSIPSLLFIPQDGLPQLAVGAFSKVTFKQAFKEIMNVKE